METFKNPNSLPFVARGPSEPVNSSLKYVPGNSSIELLHKHG